MAGAQASITVVGGSRREDYVLPVGMTIAGLLALIEVDLTSLQARLTLGCGREVDPSDVICRYIPSGSVVTIFWPTPATRRSSRPSRREYPGQSRRWGRPRAHPRG